jgi:NADH:ubiquinone oxidoreductase subunit 5 (subunit L)/multisubunit Na+/H+ antiporter MnhA subunit
MLLKVFHFIKNQLIMLLMLFEVTLCFSYWLVFYNFCEPNTCFALKMASDVCESVGDGFVIAILSRLLRLQYCWKLEILQAVT